MKKIPFSKQNEGQNFFQNDTCSAKICIIIIVYKKYETRGENQVWSDESLGEYRISTDGCVFDIRDDLNG